MRLQRTHVRPNSAPFAPAGLIAKPGRGTNDLFMKLSLSFYRSVALCSVLSAVTTLGLIFLPDLYRPVEGFEGRMTRVDDPAYVLRSWVYLIHPFLTFAAALGIGLRIRALRPAAAIIGLEATRAIIRANTAMYDGLWDALYFLLLIGFSIGNLCLGIALVGAGRGLTRLVGFFLLAACALTLTIITRELQWWTLPEPLASWSYPAIQPLGRVLIGLWLWRAAHEEAPLPIRFSNR